MRWQPLCKVRIKKLFQSDLFLTNITYATAVYANKLPARIIAQLATHGHSTMLPYITGSDHTFYFTQCLFIHLAPNPAISRMFAHMNSRLVVVSANFNNIPLNRSSLSPSECAK